MKKIVRAAKKKIINTLSILKSHKLLENYLSNTINKKRILLVSHQLTTTGSPLMLYSLAEKLKNEGFLPLVVSYRGGSLKSKFEDIGIPVILGEVFQTELLEFENIAKHFDKILVNTIVCCSAVEQHSDAIWWIHEGENITKDFTEMFPNLENTLRKAKNIYVVSDYAKKVVEKYNDNIKITYLGIEDIYNNIKSNIKSVNNEKVKFALVGDICECKAQDVLADAILKLDKKYLNMAEFHFFCNKKGRRYRKIKKVLKDFDNIFFPGWFPNQEKKWEEFSKLDVFVIPSRDESCSLVALEACMLHKPIIVSENVGAKYMVENSQNGYITKTGDSDDLKSAIEKILNQKDKLNEMGAISRQKYNEKANYTIFENSIQTLVDDCNDKNTNRLVETSPLVTVITVTYNLFKEGRENFIRQAIESVQNQTYKNVEHLIIDGGSTDGTLEIFKDYPWLKVYSEPDKGIYYAMNNGIEKANGKYIAFLNSDDFWHNTHGIEQSIRVLEENNADFSYADCIYTQNDKEYGIFKADIPHFLVSMPFSHQTMFTRVDKMRELGSFDTTFNSSSDFDFILRLILSGAKGVQTPLNFTSNRLGGFSSINQQQSIRELIKAYCKNYSAFMPCDEKIGKDIFYKGEIPQQIISSIVDLIQPDFKNQIEDLLSRSSKNNGNYILDLPYNLVLTEYITNIKILSIPIMKIKTKGSKKKYYFLGIPIHKKTFKV